MKVGDRIMLAQNFPSGGLATVMDIVDGVLYVTFDLVPDKVMQIFPTVGRFRMTHNGDGFYGRVTSVTWKPRVMLDIDGGAAVEVAPGVRLDITADDTMWLFRFDRQGRITTAERQ